MLHFLKKSNNMFKTKVLIDMFLYLFVFFGLFIFQIFGIIFSININVIFYNFIVFIVLLVSLKLVMFALNNKNKNKVYIIE